MHLLWIGKKPSDGSTGDEVFDSRTIASLRTKGVTVDVWYPEPVCRLREAATFFSGLLPYQRSRFLTWANVTAAQAASRKAGAVICSWEPLDALARHLTPRPLLVTHNIASRALRAIYPNNPLGRIASARAAAWERRWYNRAHFAAIAALSRRDLAYLQDLPDPPDLLLTPPGMPPCAPLSSDAKVVPELIISGTFDWPPKRRDILAFAEDYMALPAADRVALGADSIIMRDHEAMRQLLGDLPAVGDPSASIRFGLIADRFEAGHKLKTLACIAQNRIVLSLCEVGFDFAHIPDSDLFIRRVNTVESLKWHVDHILGYPPSVVRERFRRFQAACADAFTWEGVADRLLQTSALR